jgi:tyrosyl-DNA phosphodiesterase 2
MSQPDETDCDIPDRETCQKLTEQFAEITGTDEACAQFYLQDRNWNLEVSDLRY